MRYIDITCLVALGCAACGGASGPDSSSPTSPSARETMASGAAGSRAARTPDAMSSDSRDPSMPSATPMEDSTPAATPPRSPSPNSDPSSPPQMTNGLAMDECDLSTKFPGDEYCIKAPPEDKGFQMHIGPSDYENPGSQYLMQPGEENVVTMTAPSGNKEDVHYYYRQYRMRPGSHHVIISASGSGGARGGLAALGGRRLGGTQNLAKDNPDRGIIPPENEGVGMPLAANTTLSANMHFYNFTDKPIIREVWVNFWYKDAAAVTETASEIFSLTGVSAAVAHSHVVVGATCSITGSGRVLTMYGHRHLNNKRFSAWLERDGTRNLVLEDFDPEHPTVLEYNSIAMNPSPDAMVKRAGGHSGILDLQPGDTLSFECEILNDTDKNFTGANEANDDEMCILVGDTAGTQIPAFCSAMPARNVTGADE